jgi:hypothetical protein
MDAGVIMILSAAFGLSLVAGYATKQWVNAEEKERHYKELCEEYKKRWQPKQPRGKGGKFVSRKSLMTEQLKKEVADRKLTQLQDGLNF